MSNIVRAIRTRVLLDNLSTGDERWAALVGCELVHPQYGKGTILDVKAERFRDAIFGVKWLTGKTSPVSTASFINGKVPRVIVPDDLAIPPKLSQWVHEEESDQYRKQRLAAEDADKTPRRRTSRSARTHVA
jgi:hypothetical protein